jgi:hypothetical protein
MRKLFIILLSIGSYLTAFSQEKGSFEFGFNVGYNLATVTSGSNTNSTYRSAFNAGGFGDYYFSDRWSIKAKLIYDQKGWDKGFLTNLDNGQSFETNYRMDYLTIPIMANWHFGKKRNWYLNFGPYAGFLLSAKETTFNTDIKDLTASTDVGLALGIGVKISIANRLKILLEIDGQSGFTDVLKDNQGTTILNSRSSFNTGLVFDL